MKTADEQANELFWTIALPSRLAVKLGPEVIGRPYVVHPWLAYVEQEIMAMLRRPGREVVILSVPPQEGKTTYSGMWLPFWYLGFWPDNQIIFVTYNDEYSGTWGLRVRNLVRVYGPRLFNIGLNEASQQINNWKTTKGFGGMLSAGIGGGITGNPGHFIIIDDVIKNMEEAGSPTTKRKHLEEWDGSISARFQEDTKILITATRWSEDDLSGEIYARSVAEEYDGIPVRVIKIKAIAEPDDEEDEDEEWIDCLGRKRGEHLVGQHSSGFFREKKASVSHQVWSCLYQANPTSREGSMFPPDAVGWYDPATRPDMLQLRRGWDIAATEGAGDFTAGPLIGKAADNRVYILDMRRFQKSTSGVKDEVLRTARADGRGISILMEQERAGAGKSVVEAYEHDLQGYDFKGIRPEGEKAARFVNYSDMWQRGHVLLPRNPDGTSPPWVEEFIREHKQQMPPDPSTGKARGPRHDDQIDAVAMCVNDLYGLGPIEVLDPSQVPTTTITDEIERVAQAHNLTMARPLPDRLAQILGR